MILLLSFPFNFLELSHKYIDVKSLVAKLRHTKLRYILKLSVNPT